MLLANRETEGLLIEGSFGLGDEYLLALNTKLKQKITGDGPDPCSPRPSGMPVYTPT